MTFAYFLVGAVLVFGVYWGVKYTMLPPPPPTTTTTTTTTTTEEPPESTEPPETTTAPPTTITTTASPTTTTPTTTTTTEPALCTKKGYKYIAESGYCYKYYGDKMEGKYYDWGEARYKCEEDGTMLSTAPAPARKETPQLIALHRNRARAADFLAVGFYQDESQRGKGDNVNYDDKRVEGLSISVGPLLKTEPKYMEDFRTYAFMNRKGALMWYSINRRGPFVCEYQP